MGAIQGCVVTALLGFASAIASAAPTFTGLGFLDSSVPVAARRSYATGISGDGLIVSGFSTISGGFRGFRWSAGAGMLTIGALDSADPYSDAIAISADGGTVVGESRFGDAMVAHRWTAIGGIEAFGFPLSGSSSNALAVSANGQYIAGYTETATGRRGFRWSQATGLQPFGDSGDSIQPNGISANGSVIVGSKGGVGAFIWDAINGVRALGTITPNSTFFAASAWAVTPDAAWVVGSGDQAFRWSAGTGFQLLGPQTTRAMGVSADARVIVGDRLTAVDSRAFIWDQTNGARDLKGFLTGELGLDLTGWTLEYASAISSDGNTIAGVGINPAGQEEGWVTVVPEPSFCALGLVVLCRRFTSRGRR